ncbi:MAG: hypothetical protein ABSG14_12120 [Verrucomicrobiia bacterium]|jgi:hypothetical protein
MTWLEQRDFLKEIQGKLPSRCTLATLAKAEGGRLRDVLAETERRSREATDAAVRKIYNSEAWPHLGREEQYFLKQRILFGLVLTNALAAPAKFSASSNFPNLPPDFGRAVQIEWLLNDAWEWSGVDWWLDRETPPKPTHHGVN